MIAIKKDGKIIGSVHLSTTGAGLYVSFFEGEEISEIQLRALLGTADLDILEIVEGIGCYDKIKTCVIKSWELFL